MLQHCQLYTFSRPETLHDGCVLILNIFVNHVLDCFDLVQAVVKSYNLTNELGSLWH